jgi:hypothetical protein
LEEEKGWIQRLHTGQPLATASKWVVDLLEMAERVEGAEETADPLHCALIVVGGAASMDADAVARVRPALQVALEEFEGTVISGGTDCGVPGCVGAIAAELAAEDKKRFDLVGYLPKRLPVDAPAHPCYDQLMVCGHHGFTPEQLLRTWSDLLDQGAGPRNVRVVGFGGGPLAAAEFHLALAFGASVAVILGTGGSADELAKDELWADLPNLMPTPHDLASIRALVAPPARQFPAETLDEMARSFHETYVTNSTGRLPENLKPWADLENTYRTASREQARYAVEILEASGFAVREAPSPTAFRDFTDVEIEEMAELEHGRWNVERLRNGWRLGPRDDARKRHPSLVPWSVLPEEIRYYDREAVRRFPEVLERAGLEVYEP